MFKFKSLYLFGYGLILSAIVGILLGLFYSLQSTLIDLFWQKATFGSLLDAIMLMMVGLVIIISRHYFGPLPQNLGVIKADLKQAGTANYRYVLLQMLIPAVILVSGTSLGPEATLVSSTFLYSIWLADKQRYVAAHFDDLCVQSIGTRLKVLATPHRYLLHYQQPTTSLTKVATYQKKALIVTYFLNGTAWLSGVFILTGQPSLIIRLGQSHWQGRDLYWFLPLVLGGYLLGKLWLAGMVGLRKIMQARLTNDQVRVLIGGLAIFLASLFFPHILFSGQHNFHLFTTIWQDQSMLFLMSRSLLKLILLTICLNTGWLGGDIFPVLFASTAQGMAISQLFPQVDSLFVIGLIAISMGSAILEAPLVAGLIMVILFLPPNLFWVGIIATGIVLGLEKYRQHHQARREQHQSQGARLHQSEA